MPSTPEPVYNDDVLPALRELISQHPAAAGSSPEELAGLLRMLGYMNRRPVVYEVEAAFEALCVEGEIAA